MFTKLTIGEILGFLFLGYVLAAMLDYIFIPMAKTAVMWHDRGYSFYL